MPGVVYGPGDHSSLGAVLHQAATGKLPSLTFGDLGMNAAHVEDIAAGIALVGEKGSVGESYVLGGELTTMAELIRRVAAIAAHDRRGCRRQPGRCGRRRRSCAASAPTSARSSAPAPA